MSDDRKMLVIGAGLPRTGTMTMQTALEKLLGGKCYHMKEFVLNGTKTDVQMFDKGLRGEAKTEDWREFFARKKVYRACVDYPTSYFYKVISFYPR